LHWYLQYLLEFGKGMSTVNWVDVMGQVPSTPRAGTALGAAMMM